MQHTTALVALNLAQVSDFAVGFVHQDERLGIRRDCVRAALTAPICVHHRHMIAACRAFAKAIFAVRAPHARSAVILRAPPRATLPLARWDLVYILKYNINQ